MATPEAALQAHLATGVVAEYGVALPDTPYLLAYVVIETAAAGGYMLHLAPGDADSGAPAFPYWRPDLQAAHDAARDITMGWACKLRDHPEQGGDDYYVQVCDGAGDLTEEIPLPARESKTKSLNCPPP